MLTGDTSPSSGTAIISGYDIRTHIRKVMLFTIVCIVILSDFVPVNYVMQMLIRSITMLNALRIVCFSHIKVQKKIGYCPQFDALIERMTGRELLTMFARLRGIPERLISQAVETEVTRLDLTQYASKLCGKYRYEMPKPICTPKTILMHYQIL